MQLPTLEIIIVNWNSGALILECIASLKKSINETFILNKVIVVDNNSSDGSIENIKEDGLPLKIIMNKKNYGFGKACNQAAKGSKADYLLMLNPDTKVYENSLSKPIKFMEDSQNQNIGIVGVKLVDENNNTLKNCARFPTAKSLISSSFGLDKIIPSIFKPHFMVEWNHEEDRIVDQVMGSFLLIRRELFEKLNGYDERFFVYYEDLDLSLRVNQMGYKSFYLSEAKIYHKGGGTTEKVKAIRLAYNLNSKLLYAKKHFSRSSYFFVYLSVLFIEPCTRIFYLLLQGKIQEITEVFSGYKKLFLKVIFKKSFK